MRQFKAGDKVICVDISNINYRTDLALNEVYTVKKCPYANEIYLEELNNGSWYEYRFRCAKKYLHAKEYNNRLDKLVEND